MLIEVQEGTLVTYQAGGSTPLIGDSQFNNIFERLTPSRLDSDDFTQIRNHNGNNEQVAALVWDIGSEEIIDFRSQANYYYCSWEGSNIFPSVTLANPTCYPDVVLDPDTLYANTTSDMEFRINNDESPNHELSSFQK